MIPNPFTKYAFNPMTHRIAWTTCILCPSVTVSHTRILPLYLFIGDNGVTLFFAHLESCEPTLLFLIRREAVSRLILIFSSLVLYMSSTYPLCVSFISCLSYKLTNAAVWVPLYVTFHLSVDVYLPHAWFLVLALQLPKEPFTSY